MVIFFIVCGKQSLQEVNGFSFPLIFKKMLPLSKNAKITTSSSDCLVIYATKSNISKFQTADFFYCFKVALRLMLSLCIMALIDFEMFIDSFNLCTLTQEPSGYEAI